MASAGKSTRSKKSAESPPPAPASVVVEQQIPAPRVRRFSPALVVPVIFLIAIIGVVAVLSRFVPDLRDRPEYQFRTAEMKVTPPHKWVPATIMQEVIAAAHLPETVSLLDPHLCREVAAAWQHHPWVKQVNSVRITTEPALVVDLEYREPAALIRVADGYYPIDTEGVLLPPRDFALGATELLPQVSNITSTPQGGTGVKWDDPVVIAAARLAMVLAPKQDLSLYWNKFQLKAIIAPTVSVPPTPGQMLFELETAGGNRVLWGRPPGEDALEPTPQVKLARLAEYQSRFGSLDGVSGRHRIDIRLFDGISLHPLSIVR